MNHCTGSIICAVCECYDRCLPLHCCGFPASSRWQWQFRLINTLRAYTEKRKVPEAQATQLAAVDDDLDALYERLSDEQRRGVLVLSRADDVRR